MNARFDICQAAHDAKLPPPVSETPEEIARAEWLYNAVEQLVRFGQDVKFQRRMSAPQGVTMQQLALGIDEHANNRLAECEVNSPALGNLLIAMCWGRIDKCALDDLMGRSDHPFGIVGEIAEKLLQPLVDDALIAQAEDDLL